MKTVRVTLTVFLFMCILTSIIMEQSASNRKIAVVFSELLM